MTRTSSRCYKPQYVLRWTWTNVLLARYILLGSSKDIGLSIHIAATATNDIDLSICIAPSMACILKPSICIAGRWRNMLNEKYRITYRIVQGVKITHHST